MHLSNVRGVAFLFHLPSKSLSVLPLTIRIQPWNQFPHDSMYILPTHMRQEPLARLQTKFTLVA